MIKRLFIYITMAILFTACSTEDMALKGNDMTPPAEENSNEDKTPDAEPEQPGIYAILESEEQVGEERQSRSSLDYSWREKKMKFSWETSDHIGVYTVPENPVNVSMQKFSIVPDATYTDPLKRQFHVPGAVNAVISTEFPYLAFKTAEEANYPQDSYEAPITYLSQTQTSNVDFSCYPYSSKVNTQEYKDNKCEEKYNASEHKASKHLIKYDYAVSAPAQAMKEDCILFTLKRIGTVVRLYLWLPDPIIYDSIQIVNQERFFIHEAKMDISKAFNGNTLSRESITKSLVDGTVNKSHVMSLKLYQDDKTPGMDFTKTNGTPVHPEHYDAWGDAYMMAYMMVFPVDLRGTTCNNMIYLCGHTVDADGNKQPKYYKCEMASKPEFTPNMLYLWSPDGISDSPITFEAITVEEWKAGTTFDNGEGGNGTGSW